MFVNHVLKTHKQLYNISVKMQENNNVHYYFININDQCILLLMYKIIYNA